MLYYTPAISPCQYEKPRIARGPISPLDIRLAKKWGLKITAADARAARKAHGKQTVNYGKRNLCSADFEQDTAQ
jgi:hypothetical protein